MIWVWVLVMGSSSHMALLYSDNRNYLKDVFVKLINMNNSIENNDEYMITYSIIENKNINV